MENIEKKSREQNEKFPDHIKVFRVRHGETEYKEQLRGNVGEEEFDLTYGGMEQVEAAAARIAARLNNGNDIVCVVSSPRKRARDSARIMREYFRAHGFTVWADPKNVGREVQPRVRASDFLDESGRPLVPGEDDYVEAVKEIREILLKMKPEDVSAEVFYYTQLHDFPRGETYDKVRARVAVQMRKLQRVARLMQPKTEKRIVVVQVEHGETMDSMLKAASAGKYAGEKGSGTKHAEIIEMTIPAEGDKAEVVLIDRDNKPVKLEI